MTTKSKGDSVRQRLLKLSEQSRIPFENIETVFMIERLVARLIADEQLRKSLVFKGGFVGLRVYESPRHTVDLDALLMKSNIEKTLPGTRAAAERDLTDGDWFHFDGQIDLATQGEYGGVRQIYHAGIGERLKNVKRAQVVNFDLGIGDPVTPGPVAVETKMMLSNESLSWAVYPIETIVAEKLHALVVRAETNSRSKDIHDLAVFLPKADKKILKDALAKCFAFRKTELPKSIAEMLRGMDTTVLEKGWPNAVASVTGSPRFSAAFAEVIASLEALDQ